MPPLRLLAVNSRTLPLDRAGLAALIEREQPHLACIHGAPSLLRWRSICAAIARRAGLVTVSGGRTGGGNLVLSTLGLDVLTTRDVSFAGTHGPRPAGATLAVLRLLGSEFVFAGARLSGDDAERLVQAKELQVAIDGLTPADLPVIICAEGADRAGACRDALAEGRTAVASGVFVDPRVTIDGVREFDGDATSFPPARVELTLP